MGLVQRDGINRLRHVDALFAPENARSARSSAEAGWVAGVGAIAGPDPREMAQSDLIVMWGGNPVATQVNVMTHVTRARKGAWGEAGGGRSVPDRHRRGGGPASRAAPGHRRGAGLRGDARRLPRRLRRPRLHGALRRLSRPRLEAHLAARGPAWAAAITGLSVAEIEAFAALYGPTQAQLYPAAATASPARATAPPTMHAVTCLPTVTGTWQHEGGGAFWNNRGHLPLGQDADRGARRCAIRPSARWT